MDIKIFVVCHKESYVPENPYLYPIQVGSALSGRKLEGMLHDDEGDHISEKNKSYCELTAQYWAWKNIDAEYYGFFHYRRYMAFDPTLSRDDGWGNIAYDRITEDALADMKLYPDVMEQVVSQYDVISVKGRRYPRTSVGGRHMDVYHEYGVPEFQHRSDLDITIKILLEKYPKFKESVQEYMRSSIVHECNMFIMKKEVYHQYCEWLFDILFETEKQIDTTWYSVEEYRVMGYLAERLCGIYYTYLKNQGVIKTGELPKALFHDTAPKANLATVFEQAVPVVLSANDKFSPYLDVMLQSIMANISEKRNYDIIILYNDISEKNRNLILMMAQDEHNVSIRFIRVCEYFNTKELFVDQHLSVETYYRLIIPEIMPGYHKILYLDCDMVVNHDIAELYDIEMGTCIVGAAKDIDVAGQVNLRNGWEKYAVEKLHLDQPYDYFQAGVLIINLNELRKAATSAEMIKLATSNSWRCHDQDVLNMVCKNRVHYIPQQWNVLMSWEEQEHGRMRIMKMAPRALYEEYMSARKIPYMIHFAGYQKPWDVLDCDFANYFWEYAKLSPYYPLLLSKITRYFGDAATNLQPHGIEYEPEIRKVANKLLPFGSRRREIIKKILKPLRK